MAEHEKQIEELIKNHLESIHLARGLDEKKKKVDSLATEINNTSLKNSEETVFSILGRNFFDLGQFVSVNDSENVSAIVYLYSKFPMEFINFVVGTLSDTSAKEEGKPWIKTA